MIDVASLFEITASIAMVVAPAVLLNRLLSGADGPTLADVFAIPVDPPWPRGVQEEEPVRWRPELLELRSTAGPLAEGCRPRGVRQATAAQGTGIG